jgi:hypothetical protein
MFARYADTLLPATAAGVTSYSDPALGGELRIAHVPDNVPLERPNMLALHDGTVIEALGIDTVRVTTGGEYTVFTLDVDGRGLGAPYTAVTAVSAGGVDLPAVADVTTCAAPGCFSFDVLAQRLQARVFGTSTLVVR